MHITLIKGYLGQTAFHMACNNNNLEIVEMILKKSTEVNIDLNATDCDTFTAFHRACDEGLRGRRVVTMMMIYLETTNLNIKALDKDGRTGLQIARENECWELEDLIVRPVFKLSR